MKNNFYNFLQTSSLLDQQNICTDSKLLCLSDWTLWFQNGCNKGVIGLRVVQFWSKIILVISNHTFGFRPNCTPLSSISIVNLDISDRISHQDTEIVYLFMERILCFHAEHLTDDCGQVIVVDIIMKEQSYTSKNWQRKSYYTMWICKT